MLKKIYFLYVLALLTASAASGQFAKRPPTNGGWTRVANSAPRSIPIVTADKGGNARVGCVDNAGRSDPLCLGNASVRAQELIPVVVGEAQGNDSVYQWYQNHFFHGRNFYLPISPEYQFADKYGDLGRILQILVANEMQDLGYLPLGPATGHMAGETQIVQAEVSPRQGIETELREPEFVVVVNYGFLNTGKSGRSVDLGRMVGVLDPIIPRGKWGDIGRRAGRSAGKVEVTGRNEAYMYVGVYRPDGSRIKYFQGIFGYSWKEFADVYGIGIEKVDVNSPTLALLARGMVESAFSGGPNSGR